MIVADSYILVCKQMYWQENHSLTWYAFNYEQFKTASVLI